MQAVPDARSATMSDQDFTTTLRVDRPSAEVFEAISDVRGWWSDSVRGATREPGDVFVFEVPDIHRSTMRLTEVVPGQRIVWHVDDAWLSFVARTDEWTGTDVRFDLAPTADGGTELRFTHVGLTPRDECYEVCAGAWSMYVLESLRARVETGLGTPHRLEQGITPREEDLLETHAAAKDPASVAGSSAG
jgi:uncharacterized protein YndB with AHSA1/START domain